MLWLSERIFFDGEKIYVRERKRVDDSDFREISMIVRWGYKAKPKLQNPLIFENFHYCKKFFLKYARVIKMNVI